MANEKPAYTAYTVIKKAEGKKSFWQQIGAAWINADNSINVELTALPLDGRIQLRPPRVEEEGGEG